jgi:ATP-dependent RNA helicase DDX24/MAK5
MVNLKRKTASSNILARKRTKVLRSAAELPWKTISHAHETTGEGDDGILELEEVDDVEIVYENTESGRVATFHVCYYPPTLERVHSTYSQVKASSENASESVDVVDSSSADEDSSLLPEVINFDSESRKSLTCR